MEWVDPTVDREGVIEAQEAIFEIIDGGPAMTKAQVASYYRMYAVGWTLSSTELDGVMNVVRIKGGKEEWARIRTDGSVFGNAVDPFV